MPDGKERAAEILRGTEGDRIYLLLLDYADVLARVHGWREGKMLPGGASPEAVVNEVIVKVLDGTRSWDEGREPSFLNALKGMVRSEIGHLYQKAEERLVEPIALTRPEGEERTADSFAVTDLHPEELDPEQHLLKRERALLESAALKLIMEEIEGKGDLEFVFLALYEAKDLSDIAEKTGLSIERVYSLRRELQRVVDKISLARVVRAAREEKEHEA